MKKKWERERIEESRVEVQHKTMREAAEAKQKVNDELYDRLDTKEGEKDLCRRVRQSDSAGWD